MSNYRKRNRFGWAELIAAVLAVLLAASIVMGVGYRLGWFENTADVDDTDVEQTEDDGTSTQSMDSGSSDYVYEFEVME